MPGLTSYNVSDIFAKSWEKAARLEQTKLEKGSRNMTSYIKAKIILILLVCLFSFTFQEQQKEIRATSLISLDKLL